MNLIDENIEKESEEKQKKITKIIIITIIVLIALVIIILLVSIIKKKNTLKFSVNNENKEFKSEMFLMQDAKTLYTADNGQIYISVRDLANVLGVDFYNDEYKGKGEDKSKCYIKTDNEYTSFLSNSSEIYKVRDNKSKNEELLKKNNNTSKNKEELVITPNNYEYEYFSINDGVRYVNDKIYASEEAIELGFNVSIFYDQKAKAVKVYTLDGLQKNAESIVKNLAVTENVEYYNKKLLKYGLVLIKNGNDSYGITDYSNYQEGANIVSCKYSNIKFIESLSCLIVTDKETGKQGVLKLELDGNKNVKEIIYPVYQEIQQLSEDGTLYLVRENDKYGIIKITENENDVVTESVLKTEYQTIGIPDYSKYENMETRYMINRKYIPIKANNKWGLASLEGTIIIIPRYDFIGCDKGEEASGGPVVCIPNLQNGNDAVVFGNTYTIGEDNKATVEKYELIDVASKEKIGFDALEIYSVIDNNKNVYYMKVEAADQSIHKLDIYRSYGSQTQTNSNTLNQENSQNTNNTNNTGATTTNEQSTETTNGGSQGDVVQGEESQNINP